MIINWLTTLAAFAAHKKLHLYLPLVYMVTHRIDLAWCHHLSKVHQFSSLLNPSCSVSYTLDLLNDIHTHLSDYTKHVALILLETGSYTILCVLLCKYFTPIDAPGFGFLFVMIGIITGALFTIFFCVFIGDMFKTKYDILKNLGMKHELYRIALSRTKVKRMLNQCSST